MLVSDAVDADGGGSGCGSVGGAGVVVGRCWVASCVALMLVRVSRVLCWVLGLLVLPTVKVPLLMYWVSLPPVSPFAPGVSAGEGVLAFGLGGFGLGVGGGAGVSVAVTGLGVGLGVVGCWVLLGVGARHSWLRAWWVVLVGLLLCPSGVSGGPAAPLAEGCWVLVLWVFLCSVRLWCGRCSRFGVLSAFVGLVLVTAVALCVVCARRHVCGVLVVRLGACPRLSRLSLGALCGCGGCVSWPLPRPGCQARVWIPATPGWGLFVVVCSPAAPLRALPPLSLCRVARGAVPLVTYLGLPGLWWVSGGAG